MEKYTKPVVDVLDETCEGVYAASGTKVCRFGYTYANPGKDACQSCSATNGVNGTGKTAEGKQYYKRDYVGCPDNMPEQE